ncbi:MAG: formyltetrahydrofolate deformylase [Oceanococcaceae bacterium]
MSDDKILLLRCPDTPGVIADVTACLYDIGCDIRDAAQYGDPDTGQFFVRIHLRLLEDLTDVQITDAMAPVAIARSMEWRLWDMSDPLRMMIAVSRQSHCLNDLLYRWHAGQLHAEIVGVFSNHPDHQRLVEWYGLPYIHVPVDERDGGEQHQLALADAVESADVDLLVLARYMRILNADLCEALDGRCINIHHSFLPSFKGARPYHRAHERGVKLIGATAHYVTADLDEGPIIEQDVVRVRHDTSVAEMIERGEEIESQVLARAVRWHLEHRVLIDGHKTIVF